jgi:hypothetical protein
MESCSTTVLPYPSCWFESLSIETRRAADGHLSSTAKNARSVRKNPKDSELEKLRARQVVEREDILSNAGPR